MRQLVLILSLFYGHSVFAQDDFVSIYTRLNKTADRQVALMDKIRENERDKEKAKVYMNAYRQTLTDTVLPIANKVVNLTFPDVSFIGSDNKGYSISDFQGKNMIVNYNYLYCLGCMQRIDSTLRFIGDKPVHLIVLFLAPYQKEIDDLKPYAGNITIGFINEDTEKLISLGLGDDAMYYLNEKRQIEFFDKLHPEDPHLAWNDFLKKQHP